ncbi:MAG: hypothetical protein HPY52_15975 [Firmicutes bacterium]|nr:hypothetical protein [Bacillota bacterium]
MQMILYYMPFVKIYVLIGASILRKMYFGPCKGLVISRESVMGMANTISLRNQGRGESGLWLSHEELGYNYRMDELSAALGLAQMGRIEEIIAKRERVAAMYRERLSRIPGSLGLRLPFIAPEVTRMSWFVYVIRVAINEPSPKRQAEVREHVMSRLQEAGIGCRPYFTPIHLQPFYRKRFGFKEGDFPVTELLGRTSIAIPFHNHLTEEEIDYVATVLEEALEEVSF